MPNGSPLTRQPPSDGQLYHTASRTWYNNRLMARAMTPYCFLDNLKTITDGMDAAAFKAAL
ncbi:hypothetical protein DXC40_10875 [Anaerotruncus colihominis]|uniref:Uncharacterized protein n=1 Tax=Anaerotruncus colihominis TaxID=169435 RepID=A0A3E3IJP8_9FIRM|nr:hypothetical protein DXC40_10875 [Anaerotruncus colihominis]